MSDYYYKIDEDTRLDKIARCTYTHTQDVAAQVWNIAHNLGKLTPNIKVIDNNGDLVLGKIELIDKNNTNYIFNAATTGVAYLD